MPTISKSKAWEFTSTTLIEGVPAYAFSVDVPSSHAWTRNVQSRVAQDPCGGPPTIIERADSPMPLRVITVPFRIPGPNNSDGQLGKVRNAIWFGGAYKVKNPRETLYAQFDPTSWTEEDTGVAWTITVALHEIPDPTIPLPPLPPVSTGVPPGVVLSQLMVRPSRAAHDAYDAVASVDVVVQFQGLAGFTADDFVGLFPVGTAGSTTADSVGWITTGNIDVGTAAIHQNDELPEGDYEVRVSYGAGPTILVGPTIPIKLTGLYSYTNARTAGPSGYANVPVGGAVGFSWWSTDEEAATDPVDGAGLTNQDYAHAFWSHAIDTPANLSGTEYFTVDSRGTYKAVLHRASGAEVLAPVALTVY
jgi:hypothetical protein